MRVYNKRTWLNKDSSRSTGSVVAFHGAVAYSDGLSETTFLEISDCHGKISLHRSSYDTKKDFIKKMKKLRSEISDFIEHLKEN